MTTCTPLYQLAYPSGSDSPCNTTVWCDFASNVETQLDTFDAIVDRTVDTVPMGIVSNSVNYALPVLSQTVQIVWDTVNVDTADMVDLTLNPSVITLPRYGRYWASFSMTLRNIAAASNLNGFLSSVNGTPTGSIFGPSVSFRTDGASPSYLNGAAEFRFASTGASPQFGNLVGTPGITGVSLALSFSNGGAAAFSVEAPQLSIIWIGDLA